LLNRNPEERLGRTRGFEEIKDHPFFKGTNFDNIFNKKVEASFKPDISGNLDVHNFDDMFTSEEIQMTHISESALRQVRKNQELFNDFNK
jgi:hypothetical protein